MKNGYLDMIQKLMFNRFNGNPQIRLVQNYCQVRLNIKEMLIVFFGFFGLVSYQFVRR